MDHRPKLAARLGAAALALILVLCILPEKAHAVSQADIDELNEQVEELDAQKDEYTKQLEALADDMSTVIERKQIIDAQITATYEQIVAIEAIINLYEEEIGTLEEDIAAAQKDLEAAQKAAADTYDLYCERVRAMEETGMVSYWGIIFEADSFSDMLTRIDFVNEVLSYNEEIIDNYNALCDEIIARQADLEVHLHEKQDIINANQAAKAELVARNEELALQRTQANELILEINANRDQYQDVIAQLEAEEEAIHEEIARLEAQLEYQRRVAAARAAAEAARRKAEEEARRKAEEEAAKNNGNNGGATITPGTPEAGGSSGENTGGNTGGTVIGPLTPIPDGGNSGSGSGDGGSGNGDGGAAINPGTPDAGGNSGGDNGSSDDSGGSGGAVIAPSEPEIDDSYLDAYRGYIWPVSSRTINSYFGYRSAEETNGVGSTYHRGIDIGRVYYSTPVKASKAGYVSTATYSSSYGNYVVIDHGDGSKTLYAHMSSLTISAGTWVSQGQQIGVTGSTGNSTGPHLHFEIIINGSNVDPLGYLP